ncbi:MAG: hypothetical protein HY290_06685 [Planctomycetia bacterium]|nr:hypothetical protein [Planctomycetia bacterium]
MNDFLQFLRYSDAVPIVSSCLVGSVAIVSYYWHKLRIAQWEMSLKHSMLERGMSPEEIRAVLEATSTQSPRRWGQRVGACGRHGSRQGVDLG